ncbi:uncharacterized protein XM38_010080 [Halomicronema hongdechloris C2206]|uniref:Type IV pilus assembly protein PilO n=1 Tax=Halomicronema hongdechloris C2206 TaxID=1641165 RepID=A0A1Z3HIF7_9CYAN|nr:hypothetical protein [Halomicronema hongdechloris]ASC70078.1 uncharacterized protein XM38_010080 [Halomicronema hongdechloris C2206]
MTAAGDFIPAEDNQVFEEAPAYPVAFGVELTPRVQGIAIAVVGVVGALALFNYLVSPLQSQRSELEATVEQKEQQLAQQQANAQQLEQVQANLQQALQQRAEIYSLLGDPQSLDTLLIDINQQIKNSNANISNVVANQAGLEQFLRNQGLPEPLVPIIRGRILNDPERRRAFETAYESKLLSFDPSSSGIVNDGSLGPELDGKFERQQVSVEMQALFQQTQAVIRNIERLEPLVILRDFRQDIAPPGGGLTEEDVKGLARPLNTSFTLEVLVPTVDPTEPPPPPPAEPAEGEQPAAGDSPPEGG